MEASGPLGASGGLWGGSGGLWGPLGGALGASGGLWGGLWGPLGASGASGGLWGPLGELDVIDGMGQGRDRGRPPVSSGVRTVCERVIGGGHICVQPFYEETFDGAKG